MYIQEEWRSLHARLASCSPDAPERRAHDAIGDLLDQAFALLDEAHDGERPSRIVAADKVLRNAYDLLIALKPESADDQSPFLRFNRIAGGYTVDDVRASARTLYDSVTNTPCTPTSFATIARPDTRMPVAGGFRKVERSEDEYRVVQALLLEEKVRSIIEHARESEVWGDTVRRAEEALQPVYSVIHEQHRAGSTPGIADRLEDPIRNALIILHEGGIPL
jgi:hypothetical protein